MITSVASSTAAPPTVKQLQLLARARLADAEALLAANRFDGGIYLCGYVVELALKARICKTLKWPHYPAVEPRTFHTHNLDVLLSLSGVEPRFKKDAVLFAALSVVGKWDETLRYRPPQASQQDLRQMIDAAKTLMTELLK